MKIAGAGNTHFIKLVGVITGLILSLLVQGQELRPEGYFLADSIKIGEVVPYSLSIKYPKEIEVIFPDSSYNFAPFELDHKEFFPTRSDSLLSIDSVVYYLTTFEIEKVQELALPVFILRENDSTAILANPDSLYLQELITQIPDSVALKDSSFYRQVTRAFNYPYLIIGLSVLGVVALAIFIFFGKTIKKKIQLYRLKKAHGKYLEKFDQMKVSLNGNQVEQVEIILNEWKSYLEKLEKVPYTKLTTKEIIVQHPNNSLSNSLKTIDRIIYGGAHDTQLGQKINHLLDYSIDRYHRKVEEIKYAK